MNLEDCYPIKICWSEERKAFVATIPDLPGCVAVGETVGRAVAEGRNAITAWVNGARTYGFPLPDYPAPVFQPQMLAKSI